MDQTEIHRRIRQGVRDHFQAQQKPKRTVLQMAAVYGWRIWQPSEEEQKHCTIDDDGYGRYKGVLWDDCPDDWEMMWRYYDYRTYKQAIRGMIDFVRRNGRDATGIETTDKRDYCDFDPNHADWSHKQPHLKMDYTERDVWNKRDMTEQERAKRLADYNNREKSKGIWLHHPGQADFYRVVEVVGHEKFIECTVNIRDWQNNNKDRLKRNLEGWANQFTQQDDFEVRFVVEDIDYYRQSR